MSERRATLEVDNLTISYRQASGWLEAVRDFVLRIEPGQTVGLVGESGSGKTTIALAIMRYLNEDGRVDRGAIAFNEIDLLAQSDNQMRAIWGRHLSLVPQDPQSALNPSMRIGAQISEILRRHLDMNRAQAQIRTIELLEMVRVSDPPRVAKSYPHQISGGMQQRVLIAMALSTEPELLILDEPTTGLDVTTQAAILDLFRELIQERKAAALYVTHNLGVVASICDRVAVLYAGELVEDAPVMDLFHRPLHPYTEGLLQSVPQLGQNKSHVVLQAIPGQIPPLEERHTGCVFAPRCSLAVERCFTERPALEVPMTGRSVRCWRWPEIAAGDISAWQKTAVPQTSGSRNGASDVLDVKDLRVYFELGRSLDDLLHRRPAPLVRAVDGVSLTVASGQTVGIVGESGSGKTTLARAVVGLEERAGGEVTLLDIPLPATLAGRDLETLRRLQFVFQNPQEALNPYMTVGQTLERPFMTLLGHGREQAKREVQRLLEAVRLPAEYVDRLPSQLSGGEKQRVAIARASATNPPLLLADEAVSALDVSVQASILNLLRELQGEFGNSLVFISHDLAVVGYLADVIAVMYLGQIMELADAERLFEPPYHPYTEALLSAIPLLDPGKDQQLIRLDGDVPSQINLPGGCPFHPRCPRYLGEICRDERPLWRETADGDRIFCHIPLAELEEMQLSGRIPLPQGRGS